VAKILFVEKAAQRKERRGGGWCKWADGGRGVGEREGEEGVGEGEREYKSAAGGWGVEKRVCRGERAGVIGEGRRGVKRG